MSLMNTMIPELTFAQAAEAATAVVRAHRRPFFIGSPGIAKTSLVRLISKIRDRRCIVMTLTNYDPADIGGLPVRDVSPDGEVTVKRIPFKTLRDACAEPVDLFLDEITSIERAAEGPTMRLVLEGWAGDDMQLHPETQVFLAGNYSDETPRGRSLTAAMTNRIITLRMQPQLDEMVTYFGAGPEAAEEAAAQAVRRVMGPNNTELQQLIKMEKLDFAATLLSKPDLLQMNPPEASKNEGAPWGSPRAWDIGLEAYAALRRSYDSGKSTDAVGFAVLAGAVGPHMAGAYLAIRDERKHLPKVDEILADPERAPVPTERKYELALMGIIPRVVEKDAGAAWVYTSRLRGEPQGAVAALISRCGGGSFAAIREKSRFAEKGAKAWFEILARIVRITSGEEKLSEQIPTELLKRAAEMAKQTLKDHGKA